MTTSSPKISRALASALKAHPAEPRGAAIVALAKRLAAELDDATDPDVVVKLAPRLLAACVELGMGRSAAAAVTQGGGTDEPRAKLDELLGRRRARADHAAAAD